ncbi:MAG TPA: glycosyltransferase family 4 protein, partial [Candidatus Cybelea sp.]|nr:glycosyltransferase family 4 protein [Candidatus Cybelea sp.]
KTKDAPPAAPFAAYIMNKYTPNCGSFSVVCQFAPPMLSLVKNAVILSFEGPDPYSMVGGLGTRVTEMSAALADTGVATTIIFVGDPSLPPSETPRENLELRRWCQWISASYPGNVYDGERAKMADYTASVPSFVTESIVTQAAMRRERVLVVAEDWQTAPALIALDAMLRAGEMRERAILTWNANNTYGFETIDWRALANAAQITTVSRYMKFELGVRGVDSLVVPNGIPERLIDGAKKKLVRGALKKFEKRRPLFVKVARFETDKRWMQVIDALADLVKIYPEATLVMRGGREEYGAAVLARAAERGLYVENLTVASHEPEDVLDAIASSPGSIVNVRSFVPEEALHVLYHVAEAALANSGREPFGLVGLEVMAVGGVAVTGSTGEDYAEPYTNAIVCDTANARELAANLELLIEDHDFALSIAAAGEETAKRYTWPHILQIFERKLESVVPADPRAASSRAESKERANLRLVR